VRGVHQRGLLPEDEVRVVGRPVLQPGSQLSRVTPAWSREWQYHSLAPGVAVVVRRQPAHPNSMSKRSRSQSRDLMLMVSLATSVTCSGMRMHKW
jgi:hypothetical protein